MMCGLCMYSRSEALEAVTVINGYAVCEEHLGIVAQGMDFATRRRAALEAERG